MKKTKKILALAMAAAMALAPVTVSAATTTSPATGEAVSDGNFEGWIEKEVFSVTLPTANNNSFDFIIDPQNLIVDSNDAANKDVVTEGAVGVYFKRAAGGFAVSSDALTVSHQSSMELNVSVEAALDITSGDSVKLVTAGAVTSDISSKSQDLDLCISVNQVTKGAVEYISDDSNKATLNATMAALDASNFEVKYDGSNYKYDLISGVTDKEVAEFYLTGSCNTAADWSAVKDMSAKLSLVWNVSKGGTSNALTGTYSKATGGAFSMPLNGFNPTTVTLIAKPDATNMSIPMNTTNHYSITADTLTIKASWLSNLVLGDWVLSLSDGTTTKTLTITVTN